MSTWPAWPWRCARTRRELPTSTSSIWATGIRSEHRAPTHRRTSSVWWSSRTATTRTISSASTATYLPLRHHVSGRSPVLGPPETFRVVFHLPGTILFTEVRGETVWKSGIGPEWGSESGQEEWKESPFGCILSPQRRAPDALGYFPNSFGRGILGSSRLQAPPPRPGPIPIGTE